MSPRTRRVIPFVEDRKNALLLEFADGPDMKQMASLQAALKNALQVVYQLEDSELAADARRCTPSRGIGSTGGG